MRKLNDIERDAANDVVSREELPDITPPPAGVKNYITSSGYERLRRELQHLLDRERPELVKVISWAASNGDRSENADYIYGKRKLRQIDGRIRFLNQRLEIAEVIDPARAGLDQVFFGATVSYVDGKGVERTIVIVGEDEVDPVRGHVSWISPVARALNKAREGDVVSVRTPAGVDQLEITTVQYISLP